MRIGGFQKLSLLNYPDRTACTIFLSGCNFRCPYCHNSGLAEGREPEIDPDKILAYLRKRKNLLEGVCISGGEPLMSADVLDFIAQIKQMGFPIKLDTNGSKPELREKAVRDKLIDYAAMDVKNSAEKYSETAGIAAAPLENIRQSISLLKENRISYEFRTTVVREFHTAGDIKAIAQELKGGAVWYLQSFRNTPEIPLQGLNACDSNEMEFFGSVGNRYLKTIIR